MEKKKVIIESCPFVNSPRMLEYAMCGYKTNKGRGRTPFINIFAQGYNMDRKIVIGLLSGKIPHKIEGDKIILEV